MEAPPSNPNPNWLDVDKFDAIILGTGLVESMLAGYVNIFAEIHCQENISNKVRALSTAGKKVLHLDVNSWYGGAWATMNLTDCVEFFSKCSTGSFYAVF